MVKKTKLKKMKLTTMWIVGGHVQLGDYHPLQLPGKGGLLPPGSGEEEGDGDALKDVPASLLEAGLSQTYQTALQEENSVLGIKQIQDVAA